MSFDWDKVQRSKEALRRRLASMPFAEKLRLLDALRERALAIRAAAANASIVLEEPTAYTVSKARK